ncbi:hypothetical protein EVAR_41093_1 [Eumeta japonica]|uniref:Uncharacterized protein n=1 Tax=Eumeta variegata TaxID=151549 RepID=A0A4C1XEA2_EUMVA|nr:hypothetical protein EVAR_41093_1 [Eumeta japonica]
MHVTRISRHLLGTWTRDGPTGGPHYIPPSVSSDGRRRKGGVGNVRTICGIDTRGGDIGPANISLNSTKRKSGPGMGASSFRDDAPPAPAHPRHPPRRPDDRNALMQATGFINNTKA